MHFPAGGKSPLSESFYVKCELAAKVQGPRIPNSSLSQKCGDLKF